MKVEAFKSALTKGELLEVEALAAQNFAPSDIARIIGLNRRAFLHVWRDPKSALREAYELGRLTIDQAKQQALAKKASEGDLTAIQIHDKRARAQRFEDIKKEIFSFD